MAEAVDGAQWRAQVVGDRVGERLKLRVRGAQLPGALLHAPLELDVQCGEVVPRPPRFLIQPCVVDGHGRLFTEGPKVVELVGGVLALRDRLDEDQHAERLSRVAERAR